MVPTELWHFKILSVKEETLRTYDELGGDNLAICGRNSHQKVLLH